MKKIVPLFLLVFIIISLVACSKDTNSKSKEDLVEEGSLGIFYEVNNGDNTVYLFGSVHTGKDEMYPLHPKIEEAYNEAGILAVEVDIHNLNEMEVAQAITSVAIYQDGTTLKEKLTPEVYEEVVSVGASAGLEEFMLMMYKPGFLTDFISSIYAEQGGFSPDLGIDQYFLEKATTDHKEIVELESIASQLQLTTILEEETQIKMLEDLLASKDEYSDDLAKLVTAWMEGDEATFTSLRSEKQYDTEDYLRYTKALGDDRDKEMAKKIEGFLQSDDAETYFIVVGALHLAGENSVVDVLRKKGYDVKSRF